MSTSTATKHRLRTTYLDKDVDVVGDLQGHHFDLILATQTIVSL